MFSRGLLVAEIMMLMEEVFCCCFTWNLACIVSSWCGVSFVCLLVMSVGCFALKGWATHLDTNTYSCNLRFLSSSSFSIFSCEKKRQYYLRKYYRRIYVPIRNVKHRLCIWHKLNRIVLIIKFTILFTFKVN